MSTHDDDGWTRAVMVVGAVVRQGDEILLVHEHTLAGSGPDQWCLPGGRVAPGELLDAAVIREVHEETGLRTKSVRSLAFGTQHYTPSYNQPLLFLAFHVDVFHSDQHRLLPNDPDGLIIEARFMPVKEAINLVLGAGITPGSQSTADFLARPSESSPIISLWDLNQSTTGPLRRIPA